MEWIHSSELIVCYQTEVLENARHSIERYSRLVLRLPLESDIESISPTHNIWPVIHDAHFLKK